MVFKVILLFSPLILAVAAALTACYFIDIGEDKKRK